MQVKRLISKRVRKSAHGVNLAADVNADISVNVTESRSSRSTRTARPAPEGRSATGRSERDKEEQ